MSLASLVLLFRRIMTCKDIQCILKITSGDCPVQSFVFDLLLKICTLLDSRGELVENIGSGLQ